MNEALSRFVDHAREKGMDHATIRQLLLAAGWKDRAIAEVVCERELDLAVPIPPASSRSVGQKRRHESVWPKRTRDALLHLLMFGALYSWVTSLILLLFTYVNFAFPDPSSRLSQFQIDSAVSLIRAQIAIVIVAFPIFLLLWNFLLRQVHADPARTSNGIRRGLGYLTIFIGVLTLSGDVMTLIYFLLEGQLTTRLLLKSLALLAVTGSLAWYLASTLRGESNLESEVGSQPS